MNRRHRPLARRHFSSQILAGLAAALLVAFVGSEAAEAKLPGNTHCYNGVCHRVKTIAETQRLIGAKTVLHASHYDSCKTDRFNPCGLTSSGEAFQPGRPDNAASPVYPDGTKLLVWHPRTKKAVVVRINNAGPYYGRRTLDLSRAAADKLGFGRGGVSTVHAKVVAAPNAGEATYRRNRRYAPVPGYIGSFDSIEHAFLDLGRAIHNLFVSPAHAVAGREPGRAGQRAVRIAAADAQSEPPARKAAAKQASLGRTAVGPVGGRQARQAAITFPAPARTSAKGTLIVARKAE